MTLRSLICRYMKERESERERGKEGGREGGRERAGVGGQLTHPKAVFSKFASKVSGRAWAAAGLLDKISADLLSHLHTHDADTANSLIGRPLSNSLLPHLFPLLLSSENKAKFGSRDAVTPTLLPESFDPIHADQNGTLESLLRRWSGMRDAPGMVEREIDRVLGAMGRLYLCRKGDLVGVHSDAVPLPDR